MTTFLWMLYLAFTLFLTVNIIHDLSLNIFKNSVYSKNDMKLTIATSLLWSIWYFYYLH